MDNDWDETPKQPKQKTRTNWWRRLALVLLIYSAYSWFADPFRLEYYGYCKKDGKTRDPQALMDKVIEGVIERQVEGGIGFIQYSSVHDFYEKNKNCCRMYAWQSSDEWGYSFQKFSRFVGQMSGVDYYRLSFSYRALKDGAAPFVHSRMSIDSCGRVVSPTEGKSNTYAPDAAANFEFVTGHP